LTLGASFFVQTLFKLLLTQGDTYLISGLASLAVQGAYALASNYGGLIARLILQPLEEINRNLFGRLLSPGDGSSSKERVMEARKLLLILLRSYILLSICVVSVGPTTAPLLLKIVAPATFSGNNAADNVLATFCYYIPCLAINGLAEAFVSSAATKSEVDNQTRWMLAFSAGFVGAAFVFLKVLALGAEGLVWANVMNMLFRIIWCTAFIEAYLKRYGSGLEIGALMPKPVSTTAAVATFATLRQLRLTFNGGITDYLKSGAVAAVFAIVLWVIYSVFYVL
jgi:oligosaccharide translocation protein RFT1